MLMPKTTESVIFSEAEREILELVLQTPELSNTEVADETGYRITLVRDTRDEYEDDVELAEDAISETETAGDGPTVAVDDAELNELQLSILEAVRADPTVSNAEIAAQTGARITLVRDTRNQYGDAVDVETTDDKPEADEQSDTTETTVDTGPSDTQASILELAADDPELTNAEIADRTGARLTLVRDTRAQYDETELKQTGESQNNKAGETNIEGFSETRQTILETALENPELTNAEIATETGTRITLVRDTIFEYEYDGKPWGGEIEDDTEDTDEPEQDAQAVDDTDSEDEEIELPETTAADVFSETQRAILETTLENPELTNAEIAAETGARITLVRDTRETYEATVDLPEDPEDSDSETTNTGTDSPAEPTERQRTILEAAAEDPELTNREIAAKTGARITFVRDTRSQFEGEVEFTETETVDSVDHTDPVDDTKTEAVDSVDDTDSPAAKTDAKETNTALVVVILIGLLLALGVAASLGII